MKLLHLDIETAPHKVYAWGLWGQDISIQQIDEPGYTLCWAAKWEGKNKVEFDSIKKSGMKGMVHHIYDLIQEADAICHYNGTKFDIPTLNNEFLKFNLPPPDKTPEIDLLKTARSRFRLASNKLDYVAQMLGLGSKVTHRGMGLWRDCMAGKAKAWKEMREYNIQDVILLEKVYLRLLPWIERHPNRGLLAMAENPACTNCGSSKVIKCGTLTTRTAIYQRYRCKDCHTPLRGRKQVEKTPDGVLV